VFETDEAVIQVVTEASVTWRNRCGANRPGMLVLLGVARRDTRNAPLSWPQGGGARIFPDQEGKITARCRSDGERS
jgi:D-Tyr-tRNAtyr deacylase